MRTHRFGVAILLFGIGCGGEVAPSSEEDASVEAADAPIACQDLTNGESVQPGTVQCVGPLQPCGQRHRVCQADGTWTNWDCSIACGDD